MTRSRMIAAHSITNTCATAVKPSPESRRRANEPSPLDGHVHRGVALHRAGHAEVGLLPRLAQQPVPQHEPEQHGDDHDHDRAADELGHGELPAHEQGQDHPELDHQVGRGDLERHRRGEVWRPCGTATAPARPPRTSTTTRPPRAGRPRERARPVITQQPDDRGLPRQGLDHRRQREPEDQRPGDLPRHRPGDGQRVHDGVDQAHLRRPPSPRRKYTPLWYPSPGGSYPARAGGLWLCRTLVRSGFQAVVVPSGLSTSVQPHRWITIW